MLNSSAPKFFQLSAAAALALALTACGGGDGGGGGGGNTASNFADTVLKVFASPQMTIFGAGVRKNAEGKETLEIADPNLGKKTAIIEGRDAEGNVTVLASGGSFSSHISLVGNRAGMLCVPDTNFQPQHGQYVYLSDDFTEIDPKELFGKTYVDYDNCVADGKFSIDENGMITDLDNPSEPAHKIDLQAFTQEGYKTGHGQSAAIDRAKAYKYTVNGKTTYAVAGVISVDPDVPEADPSEQNVYLLISQ